MKSTNTYSVRNETLRIQATVLEVFQEQGPRLTVRQIYYALTVKGIIPKTEAGYKSVIYHLGKMRSTNILPYGWIADNTRWHIKPTTDPSLLYAFNRWTNDYRRDFWANQPTYVEIWVEKDALAGVISPITQEFDVPLFISRGYSSMTFLYDAAEFIRDLGKPVYIYHFGDFDPSGVDAAKKIKDGLRKHGAEIFFQRMAITQEQIANLNLPTRETKQSDPRSKAWGNLPSVELDAIPPRYLRDLVRKCIESHIDEEMLMKTKIQEAEDRRVLAMLRNNLDLDRNFDPLKGLS